MKNIESRYLVADTQKYAMLLSTSYHPDVMQDAADREFLMYSLWKGRKFRDETDHKVVDAEISDLLNGDIPYFSFRSNSTSLFDSRKNEIVDFFEETPMESIKKRLNNMNEYDLTRQKNLIHLSLLAFGDEKTDENSITNNLRDMVHNPESFSDMEVLKAVEQIGNKLLGEAVYNSDKTEMEWIRIILYGEKSGAISIRPCGKYIYDGISGIGMFLHMLKGFSKKRKYEKACSILDKSLFLYTDQLCSGEITAQSSNSGIYNGEGSIVYYYLVLYRLYENKKYIQYAKKHAEVLHSIGVMDTSYDLLDGKAGAVVVFCLIYKETGEKKYLKYAEELGKDLTRSALIMEHGHGWKPEKGTIPLLGMAHGNAGVLVALGALYQLTDKMIYLECIEKALRYEHKNFNPIMGDWSDFRDKEQCHESKKQSAWCHGAGGILLSRIYLLKLKPPDSYMKMVYEDTEKALRFMKGTTLREELCICHGTCGNILILDAYKKFNKESKQEYEQTNGKQTQENNILTKEWFQPGLMNGYAGIGYYLMLRLTGSPNYLFLDI